MANGGITLTFGDCAENHVGMQVIGEKSDNGFSVKDIEEIVSNFPDCTIKKIKLHKLGNNFPKAYVYVVRNAFSNHGKIYKQLCKLNWETY
jgi:hypothetical protein